MASRLRVPGAVAVLRLVQRVGPQVALHLHAMVGGHIALVLQLAAREGHNALRPRLLLHLAKCLLLRLRR